MDKETLPMKAATFTPSMPITLEKERAARDEKMEQSKLVLAKMGIELVESPLCRGCVGYVSADTEQCVAEIHNLYRDPEISLLIASRGGINANRLLRYLDFELIKKAKKKLVGFSDISILLNAIFAKTGEIQIHGPMAAAGLGTCSEEMLESFLSAVREEEQRLSLEQFGAVWKVGSGLTTSGRLLGGNLVTLVGILGTPYAPNWENTVLFLEEVGECKKRTERALTNFINAGVFDKARALIIGQLHAMRSESAEEERVNFKERLLKLFSPFSFPIIKSELIGHADPNQLSLPVGGVAYLSEEDIRFCFE